MYSNNRTRKESLCGQKVSRVWSSKRPMFAASETKPAGSSELICQSKKGEVMLPMIGPG